MKIPTMEVALKAGMIYTGLKTILNSVGLDNNQILSSLIKYFSLFTAALELMEAEFTSISPYVQSYAKEILINGYYYYFKTDANHPLYKEKIISLCNKKISNITQEHQEKILNNICSQYNIILNQTNEFQCDAQPILIDELKQSPANSSESFKIGNSISDTKGYLFTTHHNNFKALCIILGDQELCSEVLS